MFSPEPESFTDLTPELSIDFSSIDNINMDSVKLEILGLGSVILEVDKKAKYVSWQATRRMYQKTVKANVSWVQDGEIKSFLWIFYISDKTKFS